ncbi:Non-catalytic module family EXPN protein [Russula emetica]|nr:Non-catalytic module family EXPN protein [Russula emetica]
MYKLTLILFAFFSLVFPILSVPIPVPNETYELTQRNTTDPSTGTSFTGSGTFYNPGLGACGQTNSGDQLVVAIPTDIFGNGAHCGQQVDIVFKNKSVQATVVDECPTCDGEGIDMSPTLFQNFAATAVGVIEVTWNFV